MKSNTFGYVPSVGMSRCGRLCQFAWLASIQGILQSTLVPKLFHFFYVGCDPQCFYFPTHFAQMFYLGGLSHIRSADSQTSIKMLWQNTDMQVWGVGKNFGTSRRTGQGLDHVRHGKTKSCLAVLHSIWVSPIFAKTSLQLGRIVLEGRLLKRN